MRPFAIRALLWKETRQLGRNRTALLTATFLPAVILFLAPIQILVQVRLVGGAGGLDQMTGLPGFSGVTQPTDLLLQFVYPLLFVIGGLLLPTLTTTYAIVAERERRSLELLVSLPVSVNEILGAKLLSVLLVTALVGLPYIAIVLTLLIVLGVADLGIVPVLVAPFLAAVICSTAASPADAARARLPEREQSERRADRPRGPDDGAHAVHGRRAGANVRPLRGPASACGTRARRRASLGHVRALSRVDAGVPSLGASSRIGRSRRRAPPARGDGLHHGREPGGVLHDLERRVGGLGVLERPHRPR